MPKGFVRGCGGYSEIGLSIQLGVLIVSVSVSGKEGLRKGVSHV